MGRCEMCTVVDSKYEVAVTASRNSHTRPPRNVSLWSSVR